MRISERLKAAFGSAHATEEERRKAQYRVDVHRAATVRRRIGAIVQAACICTAGVLALVFFNTYQHETAYVSLDINPSISLAINDYGRVIKATGYGAESDRILSTVRLSGLPYEQAVSDVLDTAEMQPYFAESKTLWIAVQASNPVTEAEMERTVLAAAEQALSGREGDMAISSSSVSEEERITAEDAGVSAARYIAFVELHEANPSASLEAYKDAPIHEIHEEAASHHASAAASEEQPNDTPVPASTTPAPEAAAPAPAEPEPGATTGTAAAGHGHGHSYGHADGHH